MNDTPYCDIEEEIDIDELLAIKVDGEGVDNEDEE